VSLCCTQELFTKGAQKLTLELSSFRGEGCSNLSAPRLDESRGAFVWPGCRVPDAHLTFAIQAILATLRNSQLV